MAVRRRYGTTARKILGRSLLAATMLTPWAVTSAADAPDTDGAENDMTPLEAAGVIEPPAAQDPDDIDALSRLALVQTRTREYDGAIELWEQVLDKTREAHGRWDVRNVDPLAGLGAAYQGLGRYRDALEHYDQALYLQRMNQGLHDISQVPLLDRLTEVHAHLQSWEDANQLQEYAYYIHQRTHGSDALEVLPGLYRMAEWYETLGAVYSARSLYEDAVEIIETHSGSDAEALIKPLRKLASTYRKERYPEQSAARRASEPSFRVSAGSRPTTDRERQLQHMPLNPYGAGERALERAVAIQQQLDDNNPETEAELLLELADWYLLFDRWNLATQTYLEARERWLTADAEEAPERTDEADSPALLDSPRALVLPMPRAPRPERAAGPMTERTGHIELRYDVTERGRIRNLEVVSAEPPDLMDIRVRRALRAARFRPAFDETGPVRAEGVHYRHEFSYYEHEAEPTDNGPSNAGQAAE